MSSFSTSLVFLFCLPGDPVLQEFANGKVQGYRFSVWELSHWIAAAKPNVTTVNDTKMSTLIGGLKSGTTYVVHISAFTSAGEGNLTKISVTTDAGGINRPFSYSR